MIIVMKAGASEENVQHVVHKIEEAGLKVHLSRGQFQTIVGAIGDEVKVASLPFTAMPGVENALPIVHPWKIASRQMHPDNTVIKVGKAEIGGSSMTAIAGPCTVENRKMLWDSAAACKKAGVQILRAGCFKPRTSPYDFQGLGVEGLKLLHECGTEFDLPVITEVRSITHVAPACLYADILQIGARNMQNFDLLKEVGRQSKPVMLKRGLAATVKDFLMAAEYILAAGNPNVILCERGFRTFETATRFTLDVGAFPWLRENTHLPMIVDPSHAAGKASLVPSLARAGIAAGASGFMIEVHCHPEEALCDGPQALTPDKFAPLMKELDLIYNLVNPKKSAKAPAAVGGR
ncbi:MAG TPA: 3-deoxy-7-phosphoheptulonate synthase [Planctomycetota bacterium]|nr:3-deoxy-7-phosphoheptulonate synthase [Planctomycetota bacterium]